MKKSNKKEKIKYHEPPMKYNVALHKFEVNLPTIKKGSSKEKVQDPGITPIIIFMIIFLIIIFFIILRIHY